MNVKKLDGAILNFWVAKSGGLNYLIESSQSDEGQDDEGGDRGPQYFNPSANWSHGGPIVANEWYVIEDILNGWFGLDWDAIGTVARNPLKWFMRAYVASMFGDEVEDVSLREAFRAPVGLKENRQLDKADCSLDGGTRYSL
jgi:hypothetical protein